MHTPLTSPMITPSVYPLRSKTSECQVLSSKSARSPIRLRNTAAGPGKYGNGSKWNPNVITLQSFAKQENALGQFRTQCFLECDESSHRFCLRTGNLTHCPAAITFFPRHGASGSAKFGAS